jgi:3-methyladenine DNA glycosylase AlkD
MQVINAYCELRLQDKNRTLVCDVFSYLDTDLRIVDVFVQSIELSDGIEISRNWLKARNWNDTIDKIARSMIWHSSEAMHTLYEKSELAEV